MAGSKIKSWEVSDKFWEKAVQEIRILLKDEDASLSLCR